MHRALLCAGYGLTTGSVAETVALHGLGNAAERLQPRLLVVAGHEKCGAIAVAPLGAEIPWPTLDVGAHVLPNVEDLIANSLTLYPEVAEEKQIGQKSWMRMKNIGIWKELALD